MLSDKLKIRKKPTMLIIPLSVVLIVAFITGILSYVSSNTARHNLANYPIKTANLSSGQITYADSGSEKPVVLVAHGINGGYDQGYDALKTQAGNYRVLAPSRFGYPG